MQNIRSVGTMPERLIMRELKKRKIYFATNAPSITGKPDIVFRRKKIAVFIDSDFWHGHPTRCIMPQTNIEYWKSKIERNRKRDKTVNRNLRKEGWTVIRLWEYDVKNMFGKCIQKILDELKLKSQVGLRRETQHQPFLAKVLLIKLVTATVFYVTAQP